jgi:hypothetical protein
MFITPFLSLLRNRSIASSNDFFHLPLLWNSLGTVHTHRCRIFLRRHGTWNSIMSSPLLLLFRDNNSSSSCILHLSCSLILSISDKARKSRKCNVFVWKLKPLHIRVIQQCIVSLLVCHAFVAQLQCLPAFALFLAFDHVNQNVWRYPQCVATSYKWVFLKCPYRAYRYRIRNENVESSPDSASHRQFDTLWNPGPDTWRSFWYSTMERERLDTFFHFM